MAANVAWKLAAAGERQALDFAPYLLPIYKHKGRNYKNMAVYPRLHLTTLMLSNLSVGTARSKPR